jgi:acetylornithine deacetylase
MTHQPDGQIDAWIQAHTEEMLAFLSRLVQTPSEVCPPTGNEAACQALVAQAYRSAGAEVDVFMMEDVRGLREHPGYNGIWDGAPRSLENRPVVVGCFPGTGGGRVHVGSEHSRDLGGRSLLFSTHVDTVPAGRVEDWKAAGPFSGIIKGGRLYGRGAWDTKWGIAVSLFAARCVRELGIPLRGDVIVESVPDEEYGGSHGSLASRLRGYNADVAINSEPTNMVPAPAHRGGTAWKITARGDPGRSFAGGRLANPILKIARVVEALQVYDLSRTPAIAPRFYEDDPTLPTYIQQVSAGGSTFAEATGVPGQCHLSIWTEEHPGTDFETHRERLTGFVNNFLAQDPEFDGIFPEYMQLFRYIPGSQIHPDHPFLDCLRDATISAGLDFHLEGAKLACDTYVFNVYSPTPALTLGPRGGNAHAADECVLVQDLVDLARVYARAIMAWCV